MQIETAKDLNVYKLAYELAMQIFETTESFRRKNDMRSQPRSDVHRDLFA